MQSKPSRTAWSVARRRAAHQVVDGTPKILDDPLALRITGGEWQPRNGEPEAFSTALRSFIVARSRYAEDELNRAVARGVSQCVVLGAGLDTFAFRNPHTGLNVFEVDHPATQAWKRELLDRAAIPIPPSVTFVTVDFERERLAERLQASGLQQKATFFSWLGVTPYLTRPAFQSTVDFIASMPAGSGVVFDYAVLPSLLPEAARMGVAAMAERVALVGEPFQLFFDPAALTQDLRAVGFREVENLGSAEIDTRYFAGRTDGLGLRSGAGRLLSAVV
jgi:methyltransferase (TIGR00027 family)